MVKWSSRNESFEDLETKGKTKSGMNKAVEIEYNKITKTVRACSDWQRDVFA